MEEEQEEDDAVLMPGLEITYPSLKDVELNPPTVTQEFDGHSQNTRERHRQRLLNTVEEIGGYPTARQAATRRFPLHFLIDLVAAVLDKDTGDLLEYRHLIKKTKVKRTVGPLLWK